AASSRASGSSFHQSRPVAVLVAHSASTTLSTAFFPYSQPSGQPPPAIMLVNWGLTSLPHMRVVTSSQYVLALSLSPSVASAAVAVARLSGGVGRRPITEPQSSHHRRIFFSLIALPNARVIGVGVGVRRVHGAGRVVVAALLERRPRGISRRSPRFQPRDDGIGQNQPRGGPRHQ